MTLQDRCPAGVIYDPEYLENKFQSPELDFLGLGPPSPSVSRCPSEGQHNADRPVIGPDFRDRFATGHHLGRVIRTAIIFLFSLALPSTSAEDGNGASSKPVSIYEQRLTQLMDRVSMAVERNEARLEEQDRREAIALEWKQLALVCDRFVADFCATSTDYCNQRAC